MCAIRGPLTTIVSFVLKSIIESGDRLQAHVASALYTSDDTSAFIFKFRCNGGGVPVNLDEVIHPSGRFPVPFSSGSGPRGGHVGLPLQVLIWHVEEADGLLLDLPYLKIFVDCKAVPNN